MKVPNSPTDFNIANNFLRTVHGGVTAYHGECNCLVDDILKWIKSNSRSVKKYQNFTFDAITFYIPYRMLNPAATKYPNADKKFGFSAYEIKYGTWLFHCAVLVNKTHVHCPWINCKTPQTLEEYVKLMFPDQHQQVEHKINGEWRKIQHYVDFHEKLFPSGI